jgi:hypothetical protein
VQQELRFLCAVLPPALIASTATNDDAILPIQRAFFEAVIFLFSAAKQIRPGRQPSRADYKAFCEN